MPNKPPKDREFEKINHLVEMLTNAGYAVDSRYGELKPKKRA